MHLKLRASGKAMSCCADWVPRKDRLTVDVSPAPYAPWASYERHERGYDYDDCDDGVGLDDGCLVAHSDCVL